MRRWLWVVFALLFTTNALAQFYYFGRNKVQYTNFQWHVLKTKHFNIYYYPEMRELAERGAAFAEASYNVLEERFNHTITRRIPLIFYSSHLHFEQTNVAPGLIPEGVGGFFEFLKGRVVIPAEGSTAQFKHVIQHELVHVFMESKITRVLTDHRLPTDRTPPLWFSEGLAEYWSTEWDNQAEMVMRDAVLNGYVVPLSEMDRIYGTFLMYKEGQNILQFIAQRYGREKILLLMENFWRANSFSEVMKFTIGKTYEEFDKEWLYALKKQYYPLLENSDQPSQVSSPLVTQGFNSMPVYYKEGDKRWIYYIGNITGYTNVYRINLADALRDSEHVKPHSVIEGERTNEFEAFHLFQSKMSISQNGELAFVTKSGENDALHIYDVHSGKQAETLQFRDLVMIMSPSWSPDGSKLVFSSIDKSGNNDLYIFDLRSHALTRLTDDFYDDRDPVWSPRGDLIAFSSDRTSFGSRGKYNLFVYNLTSGMISYLTVGDENDFAPAWSPDGSKLAFVSDRDGAQNIWVMDFLSPRVDTSAVMISSDPDMQLPIAMRRITNFTTAAFDPVWTDNDELVFSAFENFQFQLRLIDNVSSRFDSSRNIAFVNTTSIGLHWSPPTIQSSSSSENSIRYTPEYSLDIAQSQIATDPVFGTAGGAAIAMSDVLGNDYYYFLIYNTAQSREEFLESFNIAMSRISLSQRTNYAYGIYHFSGRRYDLTDPDLFFYERVFGGYFAFTYPLSRFDRFEASTSLSRSSKDLYIGTYERKALLLSNAVSYVHDNSLWGPTGPIDGERYILTLAYTTDIQYSNVDYYTLIGDVRKYFRLGMRSAYAVRAALFYNDGREARRYFMGGSWDLRGYPRWGIRGKKLWLLSQELRVPLIDALAVRFPFGTVMIGPIRGAAFFDAGSAWDNVYSETLGSIGVGLRLSIGGIIVLRYDIGKRVEENFSTLQPGLFYQFFFGWDF